MGKLSSLDIVTADKSFVPIAVTISLCRHSKPLPRAVGAGARHAFQLV